MNNIFRCGIFKHGKREMIFTEIILVILCMGNLTITIKLEF